MGKRNGGLLAFLTGLALMLAAVLPAAAPPLVLNHQGRLLDAADAPVADGTYTLIFSLFASPDGDVQLWSETRDVVAKSGLISCDLGRIVPLDGTVLSNDSLFLQVQVAGEAPMTPRLRVGSVPMAGVSGGVHGDIVTSPGSLSVSNTLGTREVHVMATDNAAGIAIGDPGVNGRLITNTVDDAHVSGRMSFFDVFTELSITDSIDATGVQQVLSKKGLNAVNVKLARTISSPPGGLLALDALDMDSDDDGVMDNTITDSVDAAGARRRIEVNNIGSSGQDGVSVDLRCSPDSIVETSAMRRNGAVVSADYSRHTPFHNSRISSFFDVFTEMSIEGACDATGAKHAINTKGTGGTRHTVASSTDESSSSVVASGDLDGDGLDDSEASLRISPTTSSMAIKTKGTGAQRFSAGGDCDDTDATLHTDCDSDGDGVPDNEASLHVTPTTSGVAIKTKGTGAEKGRVVSVSSGTDASSSSLDCDIDNDGDSFSEYRAVLTVTDADGDQGSDMRCVADIDDDGVADNEASLGVTPTTSGVAIKTKGTGADNNRVVSASSGTDVSAASVACDIDDDGDGVLENEASLHVTPTTSSMAIKTKGTGADKNRVVGATDDSSAVVLLATDDASITMKVRKGGVVNGSIIVTNTTMRMVELDSDGDGYLDHSLGIGVDATHRIDVAGGAYCDGTNWVNASDVNSKENFIAVNGAELLGKIDQLPISRWNYKSEAAEITHIGPTAQDFKRVFGVGDNDKSISTIDPAGIALAAIKELHKENLTLKDKLAGLQKQVDELAANAAETDALRAQIEQLSAMVEMIVGAGHADEVTSPLTSSK